jgi:hypothetical protein
MTIVKGKNDENHMDAIEGAKIHEIDQIESVEEIDDQLDAELDAVAEEIEGEIVKPQISLRFRNARFVHMWDLNATNENCLCEKKVTAPTEKDLECRKVYSNYIVSRCGCAYHSACIDEYVKQTGNGNVDMVNCPLCQTKYEPLPNQTQDPGVYVAVQ